MPEPWTLNDFDFAAQPGVDEKLIRDLATLRFLDDASNVLFVGPPGVGKTDSATRNATTCGPSDSANSSPGRLRRPQPAPLGRSRH
ncbi:ATP-binding protein [Streptomyces sp. NPDC093595]|uniref:ATP-binding protein n=1 Tax=Streptomyces sp. NPDC093595 TaxID=3366045 RepID=UPI003826A022